MSSTQISNLPDNNEKESDDISIVSEIENSLENKYINSIVVFMFLLLASNSNNIPWKYPRYILSIILSIVLAIIYEFIKI
jgi:hypothetical protein